MQNGSALSTHQLREGSAGAVTFEVHPSGPYRSSEEARIRLRAMERTVDGFRLAEEDLALRGPGDSSAFNNRGSGFQGGRLVRDTPVLVEARKEAFRLIQETRNWTIPLIGASGIC